MHPRSALYGIHIRRRNIPCLDLMQASLYLPLQLLAANLGNVLGFVQPCGQLAPILRREKGGGVLDFLERAHRGYRNRFPQAAQFPNIAKK